MAEVISFSRQLRFIPGMVHELKQSGIEGVVRIENAENFPLENIQEIVNTFFESEQDNETSEYPVSELIARSFFTNIIKLQQNLRIIVSDNYYVSLQSQSTPDLYKFVLPFSIPIENTSKCFEWLASIYNECMSTRGNLSDESMENRKRSYIDLESNLKKYAAPSVNRFHIAAAAFSSSIPIRPMRFDTYLLGTGANSRLISSTLTDVTPALSTRLAKNKLLTAELLHTAGFPAPNSVVVNSEQAAVQEAQKLGYPVVIKPADQDEGRGVAADLRDETSVRKWYKNALSFSKHIILEKHFHGSTHRLTVFNDQIVKVVKRIPGGITGNGKNSVKQLVDLAQNDPRLRIISSIKGSPVLGLDEEAMEMLDQENLNPDSVLEEGRFVCLRRKDNASAGGSNETLKLSDVHEDNRLLALRVTKLLRLDFAGVDIIISDISKSWLDVSAIINEVNFQPTLGTSDTPTIYQKILLELFPNGSRIPVHVVVPFPSLQTGRSELVALQYKLNCQSLSTREGLWFEDSQISNEFTNQFLAAKALLTNADVESALIVMEANEIIRFGLPIDRVDSIQILHSDRCNTTEREELNIALDLVREQASNIVEVDSEDGSFQL